MTKSEYAAYVQSESWQKLRKEYLEEFGECERCRLPRWLASIAYDQDLHVHHLSYKNLGNEDWCQLEALCRRCHELETFGRTELRAVKTWKCALCGERHYDSSMELCRTCQCIFRDPPELYRRFRFMDKKACGWEIAIETAIALLHFNGVSGDRAYRYFHYKYQNYAMRYAKEQERGPQ